MTQMKQSNETNSNKIASKLGHLLYLSISAQKFLWRTTDSARPSPLAAAVPLGRLALLFLTAMNAAAIRCFQTCRKLARNEPLRTWVEKSHGYFSRTWFSNSVSAICRQVPVLENEIFFRNTSYMHEVFRTVLLEQGLSTISGNTSENYWSVNRFFHLGKNRNRFFAIFAIFSRKSNYTLGKDRRGLSRSTPFNGFPLRYSRKFKIDRVESYRMTHH